LDVGSNKMRESFEGDHCAVRHGISVTVNRPWYTFPVMRYLVFGVQELHHHVSEWDLAAQLPDESSLPRPGAASPRRRASTGALTDGTEDAPAAASLGPAALTDEDKDALEAEAHLELYNEIVDDAMQGIASSVGPVMSLPDCGGIAMFDMGQDVFALDGVLQGVVRFAFLVHPITRVTLRLIKEESVNGRTYTDQLFAADVMNAALYDDEEEAALLSRARAGSGAAAGASKGASKGGATIVSTDGAGLTEAQEERLGVLQNNAPIVGDGELTVTLDFGQLAVAPSTLSQVPQEPEERVQGGSDDEVPAVEAEENANSDDSDDSDYVSDVQISKFRKGDSGSLPVVKFYIQLVVSNQRAGDAQESDEEDGAAVPLPKVGTGSLRAAQEYVRGMVEAHRAAAEEDAAAAGEAKGSAGGDEGAEKTPSQEAAALTESTPRGVFFNTHEVVFFRETWDATLMKAEDIQLQGVTQLHSTDTAVATGPPSPSVRQLSPSMGGAPPPSGGGISPSFGARPPPLSTEGSNSSLHSGPPRAGMSPLQSPVDSIPGGVPPISATHGSSPITAVPGRAQAEV